MKKAKKILLPILLIIPISIITVLGIQKILEIRYDMKINNINETDIVIAIAHDGGPAYRFILSDDGTLTAAYGSKKFSNNEDEWGNIVSRNFMKEVLIEETILLPDDVHREVLSTIDEFINSGATDDIIASTDSWHFVVLTTDGIYRDGRSKTPQSAEIANERLIPLLNECSPIVIELGWTGGVAERK